MTKRTKKSIGTRQRKKPTNYRKKKLRTKKFLRGGDGSDDICSICLEPLENFTITTHCKHKFHIACLKPICNEDNPKCPLCRSEINSDCQTLDYDSSKIILLFDAYNKKKIKGEQTEEVKNAIKDTLINPLFDTSFPHTRNLTFPIVNDVGQGIGISSVLFYIIISDNEEITNTYLNLKQPKLTDIDLLDVRKGIIMEDIRLRNRNYLDKYTEILEKMKLVPQNFPNIKNIDNPLLGITANFTSDKSVLLVKFLNIMYYYNSLIQQNTSLHDRELYMNEVKEYKKAIISIFKNPNLNLSVINDTPSLEPLTLKLFFLIVVIADNEISILYLNLRNPYLTNEGLREVAEGIDEMFTGRYLKHVKNNFTIIIKKMKSVPRNFPNITIFDV